MPNGGIGNVRLPQILATSDHGSMPSPATLKMPGSDSSSTNTMDRTTSSSWTNCRRGSKPKIDGTTGSSSARLMGVTMSGPSTFENRSSVTFTCGLSRAKSRTYPSTASRLRSTRVCGVWLRGVSSMNHTGSSLAAP